MKTKRLMTILLAWSLYVTQVGFVYAQAEVDETGQEFLADDTAPEDQQVLRESENGTKAVALPAVQSLKDRENMDQGKIDGIQDSIVDGDLPNMPDHWRTKKTEDNSVLSAITMFIAAFLAASFMQCKQQTPSMTVGMIAGIIYIAMEMMASQKLKRVTRVDIEILNKKDGYLQRGQQQGLLRLRKQYKDYKKAIKQRMTAQLIGFIMFQVAAGISFIEALTRRSANGAASGAAGSGQAAASTQCATTGTG